VDNPPVQAPRQLIPDGCNAGILLRAALGTHAAMLAVALAAQAAATGNALPLGHGLLDLAGVVEPVLLGSLLGWCVLRKSLARLSLPRPGRHGAQVPAPMPPWVQRALAWLLPGLIALTMNHLGPGGGEADLLALLLGSAGGACAQHYFELRDRAFSPAIDEARFQALQSRIRPHFFFNSLNAVLAVIRDDPRRAERMLENVAELFRAVMADVKRLVPLEQEIDLCRRYLEIEQTRLGERLQVEWDMGAVHPRATVPQLLLQPIIENAVRYGAERLDGVCRIGVQVRQQGFRLHIKVTNPIAREPVQREGNQIGLQNIRGRLALVYDLEARLETRIRGGRFELDLELPVPARSAALTGGVRPQGEA
jgi:two-component system sensor histidine kinase AlgZ